jgi:hypothetical protein
LVAPRWYSALEVEVVAELETARESRWEKGLVKEVVERPPGDVAPSSVKAEADADCSRSLSLTPGVK